MSDDRDGIDPREWLAQHDPGAAELGALDAGRLVLQSHAGNVWIALHSDPELRLEIALAWLAKAGAGAGETVQRRIRQLAEFINAADEARQDDPRC